MTQEMMLRLLVKPVDEIRSSGYKIAGFAYTWLFEEGSDKIEPYMITTYYPPNIDLSQCGLSNAVGKIEYHAFEQGIKVGDEYWFEGDYGIGIDKIDGSDWFFEVVYRNGLWCKDRDNWYNFEEVSENYKLKNNGNIHQE